MQCVPRAESHGNAAEHRMTMICREIGRQPNSPFADGFASPNGSLAIIGYYPGGASGALARRFSTTYLIDQFQVHADCQRF